MAFSIMTISIMTFSIMALSIMTFSIMILSIMTLSIMTHSIMIFSLMTLSIMEMLVTLGINDTQHKNPAIMLSVVILSIGFDLLAEFSTLEMAVGIQRTLYVAE
jgi:hypothetical protein